MAKLQTVLIAGATGMLGGRIAQHLIVDKGCRVRLMVRGGLSSRTSTTLQQLIAGGAEIVDADITQPDSLKRATEGIDVVISAVQGGPDVIIDGQIALAQAAQRNGVRRMLPSDFGLDLFKATPGEHPPFNWRALADEAIAAIGIEHIHILQGAFMDLFGPGSPVIDYEQGAIHFWGDGSEPVEVTNIDDTARMTAKVALDPTVKSGKFMFSGDCVSFLQVADIAENRTGKKFERMSLGTEADLRLKMEQLSKSQSREAIVLPYLLYMMNGQTSLENLQSNRYEDIRLQNFDDYLKTALRSNEGDEKR